MRSVLLTLLTVAFFVLHQDFWFWREAHPLLFGFLPVGLTYHALYSIALALLMALIVKHAWPSHLEDEDRR